MERIIETQIKQPVSYKKTVTLPDEVLSVLGVGPRDAVVFQVRGGEVKLISSFTVPVSNPPISNQQLRRSDSLRLAKGVKIEYEIQKVIRKI